MRTHLDGARLMNAVVASGAPAAEHASGFDTAWIDFTKGLGAPIGACLAGSEGAIEEAWRYKQMMGGALRQAGIAAAAGLYALDNHVERLAEDHENARVLAEEIVQIEGARIDPADVETNIVIFEVDDAPRVVAELLSRGVEMTGFGEGRIRAVTHLDVDRAGVERALEHLSQQLVLLLGAHVGAEAARLHVGEIVGNSARHCTDGREHRPLGGVAHGRVCRVGGTGEGRGHEHRIDELAGSRDELLRRAADDLREDHAAVAPGSQEGGPGHGGHQLVAADLVDRLTVDAVELVEHGPHGHGHVVSRVAVGDWKHVEVVDLPPATLQLG